MEGKEMLPKVAGDYCQGKDMDSEFFAYGDLEDEEDFTERDMAALETLQTVGKQISLNNSILMLQVCQ